jgi:hypothetical protein
MHWLVLAPATAPADAGEKVAEPTRARTRRQDSAPAPMTSAADRRLVVQKCNRALVDRGNPLADAG